MSARRSSAGADPAPSAEDLHPDAGVVVAPAEGRRSTSRLGREVLAEAAGAVDAALADRITAETTWHRGYVEHVAALTAAELRHPGPAAAVPAAGLAAVVQRMAFRRGGADLPLGDLAAVPAAEPLSVVEVAGAGTAPRELAVPLGGALLSGAALEHQLDRWVADGAIEPAVATAVRRVAGHPEWWSLPGRTLVVLGAASEMGPLPALASWGASVALVDLPGRDLWTRVLTTVRSGAGRAAVVTRGRVDRGDDQAIAAAAGADLLRSLPEVAARVAALPGALVLGDYVYADGAGYLRVAAATEALVDDVRRRRADPPGVAVLATPTDAFAAPPAAVAAARGRAIVGRRRTPERLLTALPGRALFQQAYTGDDVVVDGSDGWGVADALVPQQGPNYALAKRIHRWRARASRDLGAPVSANVAPPTRTRSVLRNRLLAAAYAGARSYGVTVFEPETSAHLMAALLVHDLCAPGDADAGPAHPLAPLALSAAHGGLWRMPWLPRSVLPLAAARGARAALRARP